MRTVVADIGRRLFRAGTAACTAAVAAFLVVQLAAWPPHEDETLALFVGRDSLRGVLGTVLGDRGGAPLHFLFAWVVVHAGGGLGSLRLLSAAFAVASVPVIALLGARLGGRLAGLIGATLVSASWVLLFHGVYGRMYSLFLLTSALSYLALLAALERGSRRAWTLWGLAVLATVATHPYGAIVLASQGLYVALLRAPLRRALLPFAVVAILGIPFWRTDLVLAGRFDVGVGGGGEKLGGPASVLRYLLQVAGDFSAGYTLVLALVLGLAGLGLWVVARARPRTALLVGAVFATPTVAFLVARLNSSTSPESRHLIFALPFFALVVATGLVRLGPRVALAGVLLLVPAEVAWGWHKTPQLYSGEPRTRVEARKEASSWLARTGRPDDVFLGYDPLFLGAWERNPHVSRVVIPRADPRLALRTLRAAPKPLGRGVFVFDASDNNNFTPKPTIPLRLPEPAVKFDAHVFGPFLVIRTREPTRTTRAFLELAKRTQALGRSLLIGDADVNYDTIVRAIRRNGG